jgi:hypothetical protein
VMTTVYISSSSGDRITRTLAGVIEKVKEQPRQRSSEEIRERWRLTRPGALLSKDFVPNCEAPGLRTMKTDGGGHSNSAPIQQAGKSDINP